MEDKRKKIIIITSAILAVLLIAVIVFAIAKSHSNSTGPNGIEIPKDAKLKPVDKSNLDNAKLENDEKINVSEELTKDKEIDGFKITNIELKTENNASVLTADVVNNAGKDFKGGMLILHFKNNKGEEFATLYASVDAIKKGKEGSISAQTTADIVNAKDFSVEWEK